MKNTVGVQRFARIDSEVVTVLRANAEADSVLVLLLTENVIQMFVEIVGLAAEMVVLVDPFRGVIIMSVGT